jgi:hypothetical protein
MKDNAGDTQCRTPLINTSTNEQHPSTCNTALALENQALVLRIKVLKNEKTITS